MALKLFFPYLGGYTRAAVEGYVIVVFYRRVVMFGLSRFYIKTRALRFLPCVVTYPNFYIQLHTNSVNKLDFGPKPCRTLEIPLAKYSKGLEQVEILTELEFEKICNETLESLLDFFESLVDKCADLKGADVTYSSGVLTMSLGEKGTYVINRQTPNKQIWLSSPVSGPKRYDLINKKIWMYKHDQKSLHSLLQEEFSELIKTDVDFSVCAYSSI